MEKPVLGISRCLLGENVRYNGGHKRDNYLCNELGKYVKWYSVCPEVDCGMPIPREPMHLRGDEKSQRLITNNTGIDKTVQMQEWIAPALAEIEKQKLCGFIFKSKSPSSGMERVKVFNDQGVPRKIGSGLFAAAFMKHFPHLPVEEEGRLHDPVLRENFIERVFTVYRWQQMLENGFTPAALVEFHTAHKYLLMSHSPESLRKLGQICADCSGPKIDSAAENYFTELISTLTQIATVKKNVNVMMHLLGYFKEDLETDEKQEMLEVIENYHQGLSPRIVPITLLKHFIRKYKKDYLQRQLYLNPHPSELKLMNHI